MFGKAKLLRLVLVQAAYKLGFVLHSVKQTVSYKTHTNVP
jgi:hypothetical protein